MFQLKVTADDFGYCKKRNAGILELCRAGLLDKLSLLVNAVEAEDAVFNFESLIHKMKSLDSSFCGRAPDIGLHFNLTEGKPVSEQATVPSIVNEKTGFFHSKQEIPAKLKNGVLKNDEVEVEICAQIDRFRSLTGRLPAYVDGHQHVHILPEISKIFAKILKSYGIVETRIPIELSIDQCSWIAEPQKSFYQQVCKNAVLAADIFTANGIRYSDFFIGLSTMGKNMTKLNVCRAFDCIINNFMQLHQQKEQYVIEFMVHPGFRSVFRSGGCGLGPDQFSVSHEREIELEFLKSDFQECFRMYKGTFVQVGNCDNNQIKYS